MIKEIAKKYYLEKNFNCSEAVLYACNDVYQMNLTSETITLLSAYGGGMQSGRTCGALLAAIAVISHHFVVDKAHESLIIKELVNELTNRFIEQLESTDCTTIKPLAFQPGQRCFKTVEIACDLVEDIMNNHADQRVR